MENNQEIIKGNPFAFDSECPIGKVYGLKTLKPMGSQWKQSNP
ncbi:hypothetical protein LEP1GSC202_2809 [Leptospira yanagawae serovar Saopaulo str. Sao Paulo = ATCC 700523]|uniref:Uncharacterized protein n=1 Tax=Leptospira yanagawae serovar Saopaulo str. Sao Paulo = ATCC 700523 TaxID=1249483 RepID=A0A5E8HFD8_9LEPT|nr:hypothetical protein LEP1GSC202_2809 [Leptospira yanagawae serovar Saopaulo str. Sao Paulo = ATCC 700523]